MGNAETWWAVERLGPSERTTFGRWFYGPYGDEFAEGNCRTIVDARRDLLGKIRVVKLVVSVEDPAAAPEKPNGAEHFGMADQGVAPCYGG